MERTFDLAQETVVDLPDRAALSLVNANLALPINVALAANNQGLYVVWSTPSGIMAHVPNGTQTTKLSDAGAFPSVVTVPDGAVLVAWEENGAIATARM